MRQSDSSFSFVHAADLHLGSPCSGLAIRDEEVASRFAAASRKAFESLVTQAIEAAAGFVVIAGDVYDGDWKDNSIGLFFNHQIARLHRRNISAVLLKGNHDAESVVTKTITLPDSVMQFPSDAAATFKLEQLRVALHGRSFAQRSATENYALAYPPPIPGWFNIGVLHTSCTGRPGHADYAPCKVSDLASRQYQYWALGHVHAYEVLSQDPWIVYPGNLQARHVRECGPKGAVVVQVKDGQVEGISRMVVDSARWGIVGVSLDAIETEAEALDRIRAAIGPVAREAEGRLLALRVTLDGTTPLHRSLKSDSRRFADEVQAVAHHVDEDIWIEHVKIGTSDGLSASPAPSSVIDLGAALQAAAKDPDTTKAAAAIVAEIVGKLPGGLVAPDAPLDGDLPAVLDEARDLVLGRAARSSAC